MLQCITELQIFLRCFLHEGLIPAPAPLIPSWGTPLGWPGILMPSHSLLHFSTILLHSASLKFKNLDKRKVKIRGQNTQDPGALPRWLVWLN